MFSLVNPDSIRITFLDETGSLDEVSNTTLGAVALAIDAELRRRDRTFVRDQITRPTSRLEQALTDDRDAADLPYHNRNLNLPTTDDRS
jgi:hypothetical protein